MTQDTTFRLAMLWVLAAIWLVLAVFFDGEVSNDHVVFFVVLGWISQEQRR